MGSEQVCKTSQSKSSVFTQLQKELKKLCGSFQEGSGFLFPKEVIF